MRDLNVDSLIFLKNIRGIHFRHLEDPAQNLDFLVAITAVGHGEIDFDGEVAKVDVSEVQILAPLEVPQRTRYRR